MCFIREYDSSLMLMYYKKLYIIIILKTLCEMRKKYKIYKMYQSSSSSSAFQRYSLHFFKLLRGVGVEIVERDNIL
jgi:hypothetical protein